MFTFIVALALNLAHADSAQTVQWPTRQSKIVCGGTVDGQSFDMKVSVKNEVLKADSDRYIIFIDLVKPGQVHWLVAEVLADDDYERREQIAGKLEVADAALIRELTQSRVLEMYSGLIDTYAHLRIDSKAHSMSLSCQEIPL